MNANEALKPQFDRLQQRALVVGGIALALAFAGGIARPAQFFRSYLLAYVFWIGFPLGSMALLMLHHLAGGYRGFEIGRARLNSSHLVISYAVFCLKKKTKRPIMRDRL